MGRIFLIIYNPHKGKEQELLSIVKSGYVLLIDGGYVTDRPPILMKAKNGNLLLIFEWKDSNSKEMAQADPAIQEQWKRVSKVSEFEKPDSLIEFSDVFPEFEAIPWDDYAKK
ncbi:MAG: hypothetical protein KBF45_04125 [Cyclobacteriaceae bacterium]|jgi:hypothetical protein|nr:hypothetical protein [Cyclobacteriaceae bacterium]